MSNMKFRLCVYVVAICALHIVGCASSENVVGTYSDQWQKNTYIKPGQMGLTSPQTASAKRSGILDKAPESSGEERVVATYKSNLYKLPTTQSAVIGSLARGTSVTVQQKLMWYQLPPEWKAQDEPNSIFASWVMVRAGNLSGFMPTRELCASNLLKNPAEVMAAAAEVEVDAQKGFSDSESAVAKAMKGVASSETMAAATPDFKAIDNFISNSGKTIPKNNLKGQSINFQNPTLTEAFFVGRLQAGKILAAQPVLPANAAITKYVNGVGSLVANNSTLPIPYSNYIFIVVRDDKTLNAWSLPGGFIFVTTGLLRILDNEDQLACILAHEVAHIELGHPTDAVARFDSEKQTGETAHALMDLGSQIAQASGNNYAKAAAAVTQMAAPVFGAAFFDEVQKGYDQSSETASDARAMTLASAAGYEPKALRTALKKFKNAGVKTDVTHYSPQRYEQVDQLLAAYIKWVVNPNDVKSGVKGFPAANNLDAVIPEKRVKRYQNALVQLSKE